MPTIKPIDYLHKRQPWEHQERIFLESRDKTVWAFFMEQGTGKSKVIVDTIAWNWIRGRIRGALIVCDKGIIRTWIEEHIPENLPDGIGEPVCVHVFDAQRSKTKKAASAFTHLLRNDGLSILVTNWAAFRTEQGRRWMQKFILARSPMMVLDESDAIKGPTSKQTRAITAVGRYAPMRRIATGTPVADGPFDVFSQMRFLDPTILGITSFMAFKNEYGEFEKRFLASHSFQQLVHYKNLPELYKLLKGHSHRVLKEDCFDLPPKVYERIYVQLVGEAKQMYDILRNTMVYCGEKITSPLEALIRANQIVSGYYMDDAFGAIHFEEQPKADAIVKEISLMPKYRQAVVWCQFVPEVTIVSEALKRLDIRHVTYYGNMGSDERNEAERVFKDGKARVMVATTHAASKGRNWQNASAVFYHSNSPKLILRTQSEDRTHRGGTKHSVTYYDVVAEGTGEVRRLEAVKILKGDEVSQKMVDRTLKGVGDQHRIDALKGKKDLADLITGDNIEEWL